MTEFQTSIDIDATPEQIFDYLVTPAGITSWMGQHATVQPHEGGVFEVDIAGSPIRGRYLDVVRPHRVVVSWGLAGSAEFPPGTSRVAFILTPIAAGTRVDLVHSDLPETRVAGHVDGWAHFLPRLRAAARGEHLADDDWVPLPMRGTA